MLLAVYGNVGKKCLDMFVQIQMTYLVLRVSSLYFFKCLTMKVLSRSQIFCKTFTLFSLKLLSLDMVKKGHDLGCV